MICKGWMFLATIDRDPIIFDRPACLASFARMELLEGRLTKRGLVVMRFERPGFCHAAVQSSRSEAAGVVDEKPR
jgi:hypothetical protein